LSFCIIDPPLRQETTFEIFSLSHYLVIFCNTRPMTVSRMFCSVLLCSAVSLGFSTPSQQVSNTSNASGFPGPIFEVDMLINDIDKGYEPEGFPEYLQKNASAYTNVAGVSFIQPSDLMNAKYDLPAKVGSAILSMRKQGVAVQLLVGGELSAGWSNLASNPETAAANAIALMHKYGCGIEVDDEAGGSGSGLVKFVQLCHAGKPDGAYISMDVGGTPNGIQKAIIAGAIDSLDWVNLMVSQPSYDQGNSVTFGHADGIPYNKMLVAYYAGTWVDNCNTIGSGPGSIGAGLKLFHKYGLKGLSIWAVMKGGSYNNCKTADAPGFAAALAALRAPTPAPAPTPPTPPTPAPGPQQCHSISPSASDAWCQKNCNAAIPYCPSNLCVCGGVPTPKPAPTPAPAPPTPSPGPPTPCQHAWQVCSTVPCCPGLSCKSNQCQ
jgi:hypothetical protein